MNESEAGTLMREALALHQRGQVEAALMIYERVLELQPAHADALHLLGVALRQRGRAQEAVASIGAALAIDPLNAAARCNLGAALQDLGRSTEALASYERALELKPDYPMALANSGNALRRLGRIDAAIARYRRALALQPQYPEALSNLGVALQAAGDFNAALAAFEDALRLRSRYADAWCGRGAALQRMGDLRLAGESYARALDCDPRHVDTLVNMATLYQQRGAFDEALAFALRALGAEPRHAGAHLQRANALRALDRRADALEAYGHARDCGADTALTDFMIAALEGRGAPAEPPPHYIAALFDQYADHFDTHLHGELAYETPRLLAAALQPYVSTNLDILDAGCGTGLCAPFLRPHARVLRGVDLSPAMLERARTSGLYNELICNHLVAYLDGAIDAFDVIVAADVLGYVGALEPLFAAARTALRQRGLLAFSVESAHGDGYVLQPSGRYAHAHGYIARQPGFAQLEARPATLRREGGKDVDGYLYVLRRL